MMIYIEMRNQRPVEHVPVPRMEAGSLMLRAVGTRWVKSKPGRTCKFEGVDARLYFSDGKLAGVAWLDPCTIPAGDEPGQPKRKVGRPA